jgi:hypothetical protein
MIPIIQKSQAKKKETVAQQHQVSFAARQFMRHASFFCYRSIKCYSFETCKLGDVPESYHHPKKMYMARGMQLAGSSSVLSTSRTHIH